MNKDNDDDDAAAADDDDDVLWFNVHLKAGYEVSLAQHTVPKLNTDIPWRNKKQLTSVASVRWVER